MVADKKAVYGNGAKVEAKEGGYCMEKTNERGGRTEPAPSSTRLSTNDRSICRCQLGHPKESQAFDSIWLYVQC